VSDEHAEAPVVEDEDAPLEEVGQVSCDREHQPPPDGDEELFVEPGIYVSWGGISFYSGLVKCDHTHVECEDTLEGVEVLLVARHPDEDVAVSDLYFIL
jgi:hypothetical protein